MFIRKVSTIMLSISIVSIIIISILIYPNLITNQIKNIDVELEFKKERAYEYIEDQLDIGNRIPGTQEREDCVQYFIDHFLNLDSEFWYVLHNFTIHGVECQNVLFKLNTNREHIIVLGAHYDSRAKATKDEGSKKDDPVPGANDGASGCAVLLALANAFYEAKNDLECQIWFVFFDAEDQGKDIDYGIDNWDWIEGSTAFAADIDDFYDKSKENFDSMILLDMVATPNIQFIKELYSTSPLVSELFEVGRQLGYKNAFPSIPISQSVTDDHVPFINIGIPSADLIINFWSNPDWPYHHTTGDDISHISRTSLDITGKTVEQFVYNNYLEGSEYEGNYPYDEEATPLDTVIIFFIVISIAIIAVTVIIIYFIRRNALKRVENNKTPEE